jgi:hypothetical protein
MSLHQSLLIPVRKFTRGGGSFAWPRRPVLCSPRAADLLPLGQLAADLAATGMPARVGQAAGLAADVTVVRDPAVAGPEAYRLTVTPHGVEIRSSGDAGAYYGIQTLRDLHAMSGARLPCCRVDDAPVFARRGIYHDCSRGKVPRLETLKLLVEQLARWKINELQLYVENVFTFRRHPAIGRGYSPFTPGEILSLQEHARAHHVRLVGSLASFGHLEKVLALPEYRPLGEFTDRPCSTLCPTDPGSAALLADLYDEFAPLFEAADFNICGDETWELGKGRSKPRADRLGLGFVYMEFLKKVRRLCLRHGKRMNMWADIVLDHPEVLGDWPHDTVMLNWDYHPQGGRIPRTKEIVDRGLACVVCPGTNAWGSHGCRLRMGQENIRAFAAEGLKQSAEGLLNTDWGDGGHLNMLAVSLPNFAYGAACSWNLSGVEDRGFVQRFCRHTFGPEARELAGAIETLGSLDAAVGLPYANSLPTYGCFCVPLDQIRPEAKPFEAATCAKLEAHAKALEKLRWPAIGRAAAPFLSDTYAEFALASHMDVVACRWLAALKHAAAGKAPRGVARLGTQTAEVAEHLRTVWERRNKPSRLFQVLDQLRTNARACGKGAQGG